MHSIIALLSFQQLSRWAYQRWTLLSHCSLFSSCHPESVEARQLRNTYSLFVV